MRISSVSVYRDLYQLNVGYTLAPRFIGRSSEPNSYISIVCGNTLLYQRAQNIFNTFSSRTFANAMRECVDVTDTTGIVYTNYVDVFYPRYAVNNNGSWSEYGFGDLDHMGSFVKYNGNYYAFVAFWGYLNQNLSPDYNFYFLKHGGGSSWATIWSQYYYDVGVSLLHSCVYNGVIYLFLLINNLYTGEGFLMKFNANGLISTIAVTGVFPFQFINGFCVRLFAMHDGVYCVYYFNGNKTLYIVKIVNDTPQSIETRSLGSSGEFYDASANDRYIVCAIRDSSGYKLLYYPYPFTVGYEMQMTFKPLALNVGNDFTIIGDDTGKYYYTEMFTR